MRSPACALWTTAEDIEGRLWRYGVCPSQVDAGLAQWENTPCGGEGSEDLEEPLKDDLAIVQMPLTATERLILANQYAILEQLCPTLRREYAARRYVIEQGIVEHYACTVNSIHNGMSK